MTKQTEIQQLLTTALEQRKQAYKLRMPRLFIMSLNSDIRRFQAELAELEVA